ncbi:MAG: ATP-binding protein, partial [Bacteroidota bacterium]
EVDCASNQLSIEKKGGELKLDLAVEPFYIRADKLHLTNVLYSILDNAVKYSKENLKISVSMLSENANQLTLYIKDNGIGIEKEHLGKVFEKFYRIPTGNVHNVKGFGLGIFYVKKICDAHHWKIKIDSDPGLGTQVGITFNKA